MADPAVEPKSSASFDADITRLKEEARKKQEFAARAQSEIADIEGGGALHEVERLRRLGLGSEAEALSADIGKWDAANPGGAFQTRHQDFVNRQVRERFKSILGQQIEGAQRGQADLGSQLREALLGRLSAREGEIGAELGAKQKTFETALDAQLNQMLEQTGLRAGEVRETVGGIAAERGLGRSSFAERKLGDVTLAEQEEKGQARLGAFREKERVGRVISETKEKIATQRRAAEQANTLAEIETADQVVYQIDQQNLQNQIDQEIAQIQLDAQSGGFFGGLLGGIFGGAAKILSGGL